MDAAHAALLATALASKSEATEFDFKQGFNPKDLHDWLALVKDIVALANSGGGIILIGLNDDGSLSADDASVAIETDPADFINQIHKYTGVQFDGVGVEEAEKGGKRLCVVCVHPTRYPIVFTRVGAYEHPVGKARTEFAAGTVYFRHGPKSEPGNTDDLRQFVDRELESVRRSWLDGIAKVVEAPRGAHIEVIERLERPAREGEFRLVDDPTAEAVYAIPIDKTHPHRLKEVVQALNKALPEGVTVNNYHVHCIRKVYQIEREPRYFYQMKHTSPRYSDDFVKWILDRHKEDPEFFQKSRAVFEEQARP